MKKINKKIKSTLFAVCAVIVGFGAVFAPVYKNNVISASAEETSEYTYTLEFTDIPFSTYAPADIIEFNKVYEDVYLVYGPPNTEPDFARFTYAFDLCAVSSADVERNELYQYLVYDEVSGSFVSYKSLDFKLPVSVEFCESFSLSFVDDVAELSIVAHDWSLTTVDLTLGINGVSATYTARVVRSLPSVEPEPDENEGFLLSIYNWTYDFFFSGTLPAVIQPVAEELCVLLSLFMLVLLFTPVIAVIYLFIRFFGSFARW